MSRQMEASTMQSLNRQSRYNSPPQQPAAEEAALTSPVAGGAAGAENVAAVTITAGAGESPEDCRIYLHRGFEKQQSLQNQTLLE